MQQISQIIEKAVTDLYDKPFTINLSRPQPQFGDYSTNVAMQLAKTLGKNPRQVAETIAEILRQNATIEKVDVAGPGFINITTSAKSLYKTLEKNWSDHFGENNDGAGKTVVVEYPSPNMAKPFSVGHMRPSIQGWAIVQLLEATGWKVISDNHLGDYGTPFGIWVVGFLKYSSQEALAKGGVYELGRVYIETKKALKDEAERGGTELADEVQEWLLKLENGDETAKDYSQRFNQISLEHIHAVMQRLNIQTDHELGEAFFAAQAKMAIKQLLDSGIATQNQDGSVIVQLEDFNVPLLIQKSNGAILYASTDLATLLYRQKNWQPDRVIYVVGSEQQFYFNQLFALAKKMDLKTKFVHYYFGVIDQIGEDGKREKMSSRKGVVLMEELLDKAEAKAKQIVAERDVSAEDITKIALGAVKFTDFASDKKTNILFDWDKIFALSGRSGPYVQYAAVRVNKILGENPVTDYDYQTYDFAPEKEVLLALSEYPDIIRSSAKSLEPHQIASYAYELARTMNRYYEKTPIATSEVSQLEKTARLNLLKKVSQVFAHSLGLLGIEVPGKM